jgi:hypothetical protein
MREVKRRACKGYEAHSPDKGCMCCVRAKHQNLLLKPRQAPNWNGKTQQLEHAQVSGPAQAQQQRKKSVDDAHRSTQPPPGNEDGEEACDPWHVGSGAVRSAKCCALT